jgi:hypothetical protein
MKKYFGVILLCGAAMGSASAVQANGVGAAAAAGVPVVQSAESPTALAFPGMFGVASAVAAPAGAGFVAFSYVNPRGGVRGSDGDGDLAIGYTVGNPIDAVSATVSVNILGLQPFADSGNVSLSLSRLLRASGNSATFIGLGAGNLLGWGAARNNAQSYTITASHLVGVSTASGLEIPLQISAGYGNQSTLSTDGLGTSGPGAYVGLGVGVTEALSLGASATRTQINMGFSLNVAEVPGLGLSLGVFDIANKTNRQQLSLGASFAF